MAITCKNWLFLVCLSTTLVFVAQSMFWFAEHTGLISCGIHTEQHQNPSDSDQPTQSSESDCCAVHHTALFANTAGVRIDDILTGQVTKSDDAAPDGAVLEIDHPPQLS